VSRIEAAFERRARERKKVLVTYLCVGDPSVDESIELARACVHAGADVLELGVPFSDPTADGPVIARASQRAIAAGGGFEATLGMARELRKESDVAIVVFGYYNPIFVRGDARAAREVADAGADGMLVVDLPIEEGEALRDQAAASGIAIVPLLAPTSSGARVAALAAAKARGRPLGFVYYVSVTGVTGTGDADAARAGQQAARLRRELGLPVVVGFGIDSRAKARAAAAGGSPPASQAGGASPPASQGGGGSPPANEQGHGSPPADQAGGADGVVVGTALVRAIEGAKTPDARRDAVAHLVAELRAGVDEAE
jgi:tryptophan synthase alpha chain